jgi:hypothetical protein
MSDRIAPANHGPAGAVGDGDPPEITDEDVAIMEDPEKEFDFDGPAAAIDETQVREAEVVERDKEWIDPRERVGGEE